MPRIDSGVVFADQFERLRELADAVCARIEDSGHMFYPCDQPIYDHMCAWFGDPYFTVPEFTW